MIPLLRIDYFNPVVEDWNEEAQAEELRQRGACDFCLYFITPKMTGFYSIAEAVDDAHRRGRRAIFSYESEDDGLFFTRHQVKSIRQVGELVERAGGVFLYGFHSVVVYLNEQGLSCQK